MATSEDNDGATRFLPEAFKQKRARQKTPPPAPEPTADDDHDPMEDAELPFDSEPTPAPTPAPAPAPAQGNEAVLMHKIDRLLDTMERLQRENADLKRQLTERDAPKDERKKPRIQVDVGEAEVDEAKLRDEFPTLLPTVRAIARKEVKAALDALAPQLERLFEQTDEAVGSVRETAQQVVKSSFERALHNAIPDFDALHRDEKFQQYIDGRAPMQPRGVTIRAVLSHAWQNQDIDTISEIIGAFKSNAQTTKRGAADQFVQPQTPRGPAPTPRDPSAATKLKQSDWNKARQKLSRGELTAADYAPIRKKFEQAKSEGRLVDDTAAPASAA